MFKNLLNGIFDNYQKLTKRERNREQMDKIRQSGKDGERHFEQDNTFSKIERVHHGADYQKTVHDSSGRERVVPYEVKRNNSPLSRLQKKTRGLRVVKYIDTPYGQVKKMYDRFGNEKRENPLTNKFERVRKRDTLEGGLLGFGSSSKPKKPISSNKKFLDAFFSSSKPSGRRKSSSVDLWGSNSGSGFIW